MIEQERRVNVFLMFVSIKCKRGKDLYTTLEVGPITWQLKTGWVPDVSRNEPGSLQITIYKLARREGKGQINTMNMSRQ